jgi:hypothetical protein
MAVNMTIINVTIKAALVLLLGILPIAAWTFAGNSGPVSEEKDRTPVLVELFTSEGCSSCPPADRLLEKFDQQPVAGEELIVLSEHVDYWNHIGWKDPYSSRFYSDRQSAYARRFGLDGPYTPQMVVDGSSEFVGSDTVLAEKSLAEALSVAKIPVHLSLVSAGTSDLHAHIETGALESSSGAREAEVYVAVALNRAESQVSAGENAGHKLVHVSVVRHLERIGVVKQGESLSHDVQLNLDPNSDLHNLRLIAFIQEPHQGKVLGAALVPVSAR